MTLKGKHAPVTGSSRGIGRGIAFLDSFQFAKNYKSNLFGP